MPVQLDIAGNFGKGAQVRESALRAGEQRQARQLYNEGARRALATEMGGNLPPEISQLYDPYELQMGQMFKGLFNGENRRMRQDARALRRAGVPTAMQADAMNIDRMQTYADGGEVEDEQFHPVREFVSALGGRAAEAVSPRNVVPNYMRAADETDAGLRESVSGFGDANARQRGAMTRNAAWEGVKGVGKMGLGFLQDLTAPLQPVAEGVMGALGFTGEVQDGAAPGATTEPDKAAAVQAQAPVEGPPEPESPSAGGGAATPRQASSPPTPFVGEPTPDQHAAQLGNVDIMPDEMPSMGTRDWVAYRQEMVPALMMQGATAQQAHEQITQMQHQGFLRYGQQAAMMLQAGNLQGAARSLKAAYQYFPNGSDVKFGFQNGHLVGLATNEETGEVLNKPQVITPEYLAAMMTNFQAPEKFLAWTKDWRDDVFREKQYEEVTRPNAQNMMNYRNESLDVQREGNAVSALRAQASAAGGGPSEADYARSEETFRTSLEALGLDDENAARELASVMAQIRTRAPVAQLPDNTIIRDIYQAYQNGQLDAVKARLGIR